MCSIFMGVVLFKQKCLSEDIFLHGSILYQKKAKTFVILNLPVASKLKEPILQKSYSNFSHL